MIIIETSNEESRIGYAYMLFGIIIKRLNNKVVSEA